MSDFYNTIINPSEGKYTIKGSKFLSYAFEVRTLEEVHEKLEQIKSKHPKASHHCYAYRMALDKNIFRANDDGEPSYSAGKPILYAIDSHKLLNILVVVVRYFGGTQLGVPGLIDAYNKTALEALQVQNFIEKKLFSYWNLYCNYAIMNDIAALIKKNDIMIEQVEYTNDGALYKLKIALQNEKSWSAIFKDFEDLEITHLFNA